MFVRINYGSRKGELREFAIEAAQAMLRDGRALPAFFEPTPQVTNAAPKGAARVKHPDHHRK